MTKNIVLDLGGVIVDLDIEASVSAFRAMDYAHADTLIDPYLQSGIMLDLEEGKATSEQFIDHVKQGMPRPTSTGEILRAMYKAITGIAPYKLPMLRELRKKYNVYMLSNTNAIMFDYMSSSMFTAEGLTVNDYFDHLFLSYRMELVKPYEPIFRKMTEEGGFKAEETLFIDDAPANIATAEKLGFRTYMPSPGEDYRHIFKTL